MAINKKLIHFKNKENFNNEVANGNILDTSIVFIQDTQEIYTHGTFYDGSKVDLSNIEASIQDIINNKQDNISDLEVIRSGAALGATAVQPAAISDMETKTNAAATYSTKTELENKQDQNLYFTNVAASSWVNDSTYPDYPYRCDLACSGVTEDMYADVTFSVEQANSGNYAPICETGTNIVSIWSSNNINITVLTIIAMEV